MSSSTYKLVYFDIAGLAETARIMFRLAKQEFEDKRYPFKFVDGKAIRDEWDADKSKYVYEKVPILFVDGTEVAQSAAIYRFLARKFGFFGSNEIEAALIDAACEQLGDAKKVWYANRGKKEDLTEKFFQGELKTTLRLFSQQAEKLKSSKGHLIGSKLSLVDILIYQLNMMAEGEANVELQALVKEFPVIQAIMDKTKEAVGPLPKMM